MFSPLGKLGDLYVEVDQTFAITYPELDSYPNRSAADYFGIWASNVSAREQQAQAVIEHGPKPTVFAYLKQFPARDPLIQSLIDLGIPSLIYSPSAADSGIWRNRTSSIVRIVSKPVNATEVLNDCQLVVCNGGCGLVLQSLLAGKPVLSFPLTLDQRLHAEKVQALGAGISCDPSRKERMSELIVQILSNRSYTESSIEFRQKYHQRIGTPSNLDRVVNRIVEFL